MKRRLAFLAFSFALLSINASLVNAQVIFRGGTSDPATSTFIPGQDIELEFTITGLSSPVTLQLKFLREHAEVASAFDAQIKPDSSGSWHGKVKAFVDKKTPLGYYRVDAKLSDGTLLQASGTRAAGYLTYAIVPDPADRRDFGESASRFGMQGGFSDETFELLPLLGIRWQLMGSYAWKAVEPKYSGQLHDANHQALKKPAPAVALPAASRASSRPWKTYEVFTLLNSALPAWAADPATLGTKNKAFGALNQQGEARLSSFVGEVAAETAQRAPQENIHLYQLTWEPAKPWAYGGTAEQLVKIYQLAYPAIHAADPKAKVIGPTLFTGPGQDVQELPNLWKAGLAKYLDGFSMHPYCYCVFPPEKGGFITDLQTQLKQANEAAGHKLPFFGTEHGYQSKSVDDEINEAHGDIRITLIMLGEGAGFDFAFYIADFFDLPTGGYGFYSNLDPSTKFGSKRISPKPVAPAFAAMTHLLDGSSSQGQITGLGANTVAYRFDAQGKGIIAIWNYGDQPQTETIAVPAANVGVSDWMGNVTSKNVAGGKLTLQVGKDPTYVIFAN